MLKTDNWPEFIKSAIIYLIPVVSSLWAFVMLGKAFFKNRLEIAQEMSAGKTAIEKLDKMISDNKEMIRKQNIKIEEMEELEREIADLKKRNDDTRRLVEEGFQRQLDWLMKK